jgi:hypothetical protein
VRSFNDEVLEIDRVDGDGMPDGTTYLRMEDIKMVGFNGLEENRRTKLFASWKR